MHDTASPKSRDTEGIASIFWLVILILALGMLGALLWLMLQ